MASCPKDHSVNDHASATTGTSRVDRVWARGPPEHQQPRREPQVTVIWIGHDGGDFVSTHIRDNVKLRNIRRDPRVALSFDLPREPAVWINPYAVLYARATAEPSAPIWDLMTKHAKVYVSPDAEVPVPEESEPGFIVRYSITRIGGIGPWTTGPAL